MSGWVTHPDPFTLLHPPRLLVSNGDTGGCCITLYFWVLYMSGAKEAEGGASETGMLGYVAMRSWEFSSKGKM